jgi:HAD superfamily hydrolase (TIGR01484 family)
MTSRTRTPWQPRLIALDVDGTLPSWAEVEEAIPESPDSRLRKALRAVQDAGAHLVLCSGRSGHGMTRVIDRLELHHRTNGERVWMVASNGAVLWRYAPLEVAHRRTFDAGPAVRAVLDRCPSAIVAAELNGVGYRLTAPFPPGELAGESIVTDLAEILAEPATRITIRDPASSPEDFTRLVAQLEMPDTAFVVGWSAWLDLTPAGVSKASGLEHVCAQLGLTASDVLAIGDSFNDIEMLRWAAHGVAVAQAPAEVQEAANATTAAANEDGVALELERWFS